jgi:hypothetical protein
MNGYIAHYGNQTAEVYADTSLAARDKAIALFQKSNPRRRIKPFEVSVLLAQKDGEPVIHTAT